MSTVYRESCGTLRGMIAHQSAGEQPCGWCAQAETAARLASEAITWRPSPVAAIAEPVSDVQARINAAVLGSEVEAFEREHGAEPGHGRTAGRRLHAA
jgi:hypothetical protein